MEDISVQETAGEQQAELPAGQLRDGDESIIELAHAPILYEQVRYVQGAGQTSVYNDGDALIRSDMLDDASFTCTVCSGSESSALVIKYIASIATPQQKRFTAAYCIQCAHKLQLALDTCIDENVRSIPDNAFDYSP